MRGPKRGTQHLVVVLLQPAHVVAGDHGRPHADDGENCANSASWNEETRLTPASFDIRRAPYARGYFLGDYMGLASVGADFDAVFGQAFVQNDANRYFSRLSLP